MDTTKIDVLHLFDDFLHQDTSLQPKIEFSSVIFTVLHENESTIF